MLSAPEGVLLETCGPISFREIREDILKKVIDYFEYKVKYTNCGTEIPEFPIEEDKCLELLMVSNFLDT